MDFGRVARPIWRQEAAQHVTGASGSIDTEHCKRGFVYCSQGAMVMILSHMHSAKERRLQWCPGIPVELNTDAPLWWCECANGARKARRCSKRTHKARIVAVGSVGKTSTKDMLNLMSRQGKTHASCDYNNHWGASHFGAYAGRECFGIFEIGMNHPGNCPACPASAPSCGDDYHGMRPISRPLKTLGNCAGKGLDHGGLVKMVKQS